MKKRKSKETEICINQDPIWQEGYEQAIKDIRDQVSRFYNINSRNAIRFIIQYLYRPIDFKNLENWILYGIWTRDNES